MIRTSVIAGLVAASGVTPPSLGAQTFRVEGTVSRVSWQPVGITDATTLTGFTLGAAGGVGVGPVSFEAGYAEGPMTPATPAGKPVLVEAFAAVRLRPIGALSIGAGPYGRAHVTDAEVRRWLLWQVRGRYETPLVGTRLAGYVELWTGFAGAPDAARGGSAGLILALDPLAVRVSYAIDDTRVDAAGGHETLERLAVAVGIGRP